MANVARSMIAEKKIELGERARNVLIAAAVNNINALGSVRVVKKQAVILALRRRRLLRRHWARLSMRAARRKQEQRCDHSPQTPRIVSRSAHKYFSIQF
jgi:hypothetical protein